MRKRFRKVYQFKITLQGIEPPIWRRIQVPETYTFWDLHVAIQDAMGWLDCHLHHFEIFDLSIGITELIGIPDDSAWGIIVLPGWEQKIADYFSIRNNTAEYIYDYGDRWIHTIKLEKILPRAKGVKYPICIGGKRACPPEDCGGIWGYEELLEIIMNPNHKEYEEMLEWLGGDFDPEYFDMKKVRFDDPAKRWQYAFR